MPIIDFSGGGSDAGAGAYRDSTRGATLKALQLRQQKLQEATMAAEQPRQIASPWQGAAQIADVIGSSIREGRAANQEQAGRQRFAELLSGGLTPDEMGEAIALDPETAMTYQQHNWDTETAAAAAKAKQDELLQSHGWDVDAAAAAVEAAKNAATQSQGAAAAQQDDAQAASADAARLTADAKVAADKAARSGAVEDRDMAAAALKASQDAEAKAKVAAAQTAAEQPTSPIAVATAEAGRGQMTPEDLAKVKAKETYISPTEGMTIGQQETDRLAAKDVADWKTAGGPNARKAVVQVNQALDILEKGQKGTGGGWISPTGTSAGIAEQVLPEFAERWINPQGTVARDAIRETVQTTLRQVLGSQFTQQEGEALMNRAFATSADPSENIRRAKLLMQQISTIAEARQAQADWFDLKGTMQGYVGPKVDVGSLVNMDFGDTGAAGGGGGDAAAAAAARKKKYGLD